MKIRKLYTVFCSMLFAAQMASAQQNMVLVGSNGEVYAIRVSSVDYASFNADDKLFTITNDGIEGAKTNLITATCTVVLSPKSNVKSLSTTPEVGVCYSEHDSVPTIDDNCLSLGSELKSYTFSLLNLTSGTTYYFRTYVKLAGSVFYGDVTKAKTLGTKPGVSTTAKIVITYGLDTDCDDEEEVMKSVAAITLSDGTTQTKTFENIPHNGEMSDSIVVSSDLPCSGTITFTRKIKNYSSLDASKVYRVGGFSYDMKLASLTDKGAVYDSHIILSYGTVLIECTPDALLEVYGENGYTWTKKFNITESGLINVVE